MGRIQTKIDATHRAGIFVVAGLRLALAGTLYYAVPLAIGLTSRSQMVSGAAIDTPRAQGDEGGSIATVRAAIKASASSCSSSDDPPPSPAVPTSCSTPHSDPRLRTRRTGCTGAAAVVVELRDAVELPGRFLRQRRFIGLFKAEHSGRLAMRLTG